MYSYNEIQAVKFLGSSTQMHAILHWVEGNGSRSYSCSGMVTADMCGKFAIREGGEICRLGDYVVCLDGTFFVVKKEDFKPVLWKIHAGV